MAKFVLSAFADEVSPVFDEQIDYLKSRGIGYIEPRNIDGTGIAKLTDEQVSVACGKLEKAGIGVSSIGSPIGKIGITDDFAEHVKMFERIVEIAKAFGTKNIRMFSFFYPKDTDVHDHFEAVTSRLETLLDIADRNGMTLCHENEKSIYGEAPEDCAALIKRFGGRLKSVLDMGNFAFCKKDPWKGYELLKDSIEYIHIKDAHFDTHIVPAGKGDGQIEKILSAYNKYTDKETFLTLEPHLVEFSGLSSLSNMNDIHVESAYGEPAEAFDTAKAALEAILERL